MTEDAPTIAIIGCGLIGSSLARALKARLPEITLHAADTQQQALNFLKQNNIVNSVFKANDEAVSKADIVVLATPPATLGEVMRSIAPHLAEGALVTDVASVKKAAVESIFPHLPPHAIYVPGHPIAGSQQSGVQAGTVDLFEQKRVILTPLPNTPEPAIDAIAGIWQAAGAGEVELLDPLTHDLIYACVSHMPQAIAFAASSLVKPYMDATESNDMFRRFTRLVDSPKPMWKDIFDANKENVASVLDIYLYALHKLTAELSQNAAKSAPPADPRKVATEILPYLAASCLVTAVVMIEQKLGMKLAPYAGTGFADITASLAQAPEPIMEACSERAMEVASMLDVFADRLTTVV